ncbi:Serine protease nudel [Armadillidium vulgare]|nr:Serine protease nudel [Armadillidium vulgare]
MYIKKLDGEIQPTPALKCDGHKCPLGLCIPKSEVCDGKVSCADISDEGYSCPLPIKFCTVKNGKCECSSNEFRCSDGICITTDKMCNGVAECVNGEDEEKCSCLEKINEKDETYCDGTIDCRDETDEMNCGCDLKEEFRCYKSSNQSCISRSLICDAVADCEKGEDEAYCFTVSTTVFPEENILGVPSFSNKGYLLLRVKGMWYTYFYHNWSSSNSNLVCQSFGYLGKSETKGIYLNPSIFTSKASDVLPVLESEENKLVVYITCSV